MTPTNSLDGKVIIDRMLAKAVLDILDANCASFSAHEREELRHALTTDLTGWAAVPVKPTKEQLDEAICSMPDYRPDDDDFDDLEYEMASHDRHEGKMYWECLLAASPPLPLGGE